MTSTILILPFAYKGPVNASLKLARTLSEKGYRVVYVVTGELEETIRNLGFEVYSYDKPTLPKARTIWEKLSLAYKGTRMRDALLDKYMDELLQVYDPRCVLVDSDNPRYAALLKQRVRTITYSTTIGNSRLKGVPPYFSKYIPGDDVFSSLYVRLLWNSWLFRKWIFFLKYELLSLGNFDHRLTRYYRRKNLDKRNLIPDRAWPAGFKDIPELLLYPQAFDFNTKNKEPMSYYVGAWVDLNRDRTEAFDWKRIGSAKYVLCCSMGTMATFYYPRMAAFYNLLIRAVKDMSDAVLILASGNCDLSSIDRSADNVVILERFPLLTVLPKCSLLINHAGTNSVKEAILNEVPQLLLPLDDRTDQNGVAARCVFHGVAIRRNIRSVTADVIRSDIRELLRNDLYRERVKLLKQTFWTSEVTIENILDIIQSVHV